LALAHFGAVGHKHRPVDVDQRRVLFASMCNGRAYPAASRRKNRSRGRVSPSMTSSGGPSVIPEASKASFDSHFEIPTRQRPSSVSYGGSTSAAGLGQQQVAHLPHRGGERVHLPRLGPVEHHEDEAHGAR
jgi:hypothetical protein